jgi:amino acid permease
MAEEQGTLSRFEAFAMSTNTAIGAGFLAVPWVFLQIGFPAGVVVVLIFWLLSTITCLQLVEAQSRSETLYKIMDEKLPVRPICGQPKEGELVGLETKLHE